MPSCKAPTRCRGVHWRCLRHPMRRVPSNDEQHTQRSAAFDSGSLLKDGSILPQAAVPALDPRGMDLLSEIGFGCYQDQGVARFVMLCNLLFEERDVVERVSRGGTECNNESPPGLTPLVSKTCEAGIATSVQDTTFRSKYFDSTLIPFWWESSIVWSYSSRKRSMIVWPNHQSDFHQ